jgi:hypothetical protein
VDYLSFSCVWRTGDTHIFISGARFDSGDCSKAQLLKRLIKAPHQQRLKLPGAIGCKRPHGFLLSRRQVLGHTFNPSMTSVSICDKRRSAYKRTSVYRCLTLVSGGSARRNRQTMFDLRCINNRISAFQTPGRELTTKAALFRVFLRVFILALVTKHTICNEI